MPSVGPCKIPFGQHKGEGLAEIPGEYLLWLCQYDVYINSNGHEAVRDETALNNGAKWVKKNHSGIIKQARDEIKRRRLCLKCAKRLAPVGHDRANGRNHPDWSRRFLHKKCWIEIGGLEPAAWEEPEPSDSE